jgi:hypothetical protein
MKEKGTPKRDKGSTEQTVYHKNEPKTTKNGQKSSGVV